MQRAAPESGAVIQWRRLIEEVGRLEDVLVQPVKGRRRGRRHRRDDPAPIGGRHAAELPFLLFVVDELTRDGVVIADGHYGTREGMQHGDVELEQRVISP